MNAEGEEQS